MAPLPKHSGPPTTILVLGDNWLNLPKILNTTYLLKMYKEQAKISGFFSLNVTATSPGSSWIVISSFNHTQLVNSLQALWRIGKAKLEWLNEELTERNNKVLAIDNLGCFIFNNSYIYLVRNIKVKNFTLIYYWISNLASKFVTFSFFLLKVIGKDFSFMVFL